MSRLPRVGQRSPVFLAIVLALAGGCGDASSTDTSGGGVDCRGDIAGEWESINEFECPLVGEGCTYRHTLVIDGNDFEWNPSELVEGEFTCSDNAIEAEDYSGGPAFTATYDPDADVLELDWEDVAAPEPYRRVSP